MNIKDLITVEALNKMTSACACGAFDVGEDGKAYTVAGGEWVEADLAYELCSADVHVLEVKERPNKTLDAEVIVNMGDHWVRSTVTVSSTPWGDHALTNIGPDLQRGIALEGGRDEDFDSAALIKAIKVAVLTFGG